MLTEKQTGSSIPEIIADFSINRDSMHYFIISQGSWDGDQTHNTGLTPLTNQKPTKFVIIRICFDDTLMYTVKFENCNLESSFPALSRL